MQFTELHTIDDDLVGLHKSFCVEIWPSMTARRAYSLIVFAVQFCLPLVATTGLYLRIYDRLRTRQAARRRLDSRRTTSSSTTGARSTRPETTRGGAASSRKSPVSGARVGEDVPAHPDRKRRAAERGQAGSHRVPELVRGGRLACWRSS